MTLKALGLVGVALLGGPWAAAALPLPEITTIGVRDSGVVVEAKVPSGFEKVVLEARRRADSGGWAPVGVARIQGEERVVSFRVEISASVEVFRVRAVKEDGLPEAFYSGETSFGGPLRSAELDPDGRAGPDEVAATFEGADREGVSAEEGAGAAEDREVVESDIWKFDGETLYFYNQYRGLQIVDLSDPDEPRLEGSLAMPAGGEEMYLVDDHVVLLARNGCHGSYRDWESRVVMVDVTGEAPRAVAERVVEGRIQESRLVGEALYIASRAYRPLDSSSDSDSGDDDRTEAVSQRWGSGTMITSFDLADPGRPVKRESLWFEGYGDVVTATDEYLFVGQSDSRFPRRTGLQLVDISSPNGALEALGEVEAAGRVADKFKIHLDGETLTVISQRRESGSPLTTVLETFSLADPARPRRLARLPIVEGETLHATRFDGDRVYVVTFFQVDPLWVIDLSDPEDPTIRGELEIPGFSTFIEPLGDRLLTVGIEENRVAVQWFDVTDPDDPQLADKVRIGDGRSWSEANQDEKAFGVFPEEGMILVPFTGGAWDEPVNGVQMVDLKDDGLEARGVIEHAFRPRRAALLSDRIVSISGRELFSVDASDRDRPEVKGGLELAWPVDDLFVEGDYLVEVGKGSMSQFHHRLRAGQAAPGSEVRVVSVDEPEAVLTRESLDDWPLVGATVRGESLFLLQASASRAPVVGPIEPEPTPEPGAEADADESEPAPSLRLVVYDLAGLPELTRVGEVTVEVEDLRSSGELEAVWPAPDTLVWVASGGGFPRPLASRPIGSGVVIDVVRWYPLGYHGGRLFAFDVGAPRDPQWLSKVDLSQSAGEDSESGGIGRWDFSRAFAANGLLYISHRSERFVSAPTEEELSRDLTTDPSRFPDEKGYWEQQHFLDVVDYSDPGEPLVRSPVNIPGRLVGLGEKGSLIYTLGRHWEANEEGDRVTDGTQWLDALAYDGVAAHRVDAVPLSPNGPPPVFVGEERVHVGRSSDDPDPTHRLETWGLDAGGELERRASVDLSSAPQSIQGWGDLLGVQTRESVNLYSVRSGEGLVPVGGRGRDGCLTYRLEKADREVDRGVWVPLGQYGAIGIPVEE